NILLLHTTETYEQQKEFIGNASHELQTPLAITINKLELLIEKGRLETDQAEGISEVLQIIERLVKLNKSLLLLTKIENRQFLYNQTISLNEVIDKTIFDLQDISQFKKITISLNDKEDLISIMNPSLANVMISNLLRNAVFHNIPNGHVTVEITKSSIKISNTSDGIELDKDHIFARFYKPNSNSKGTGLGLAMVKAIADLYAFDLTYHFENNLHTFLIKTPEL
ncbi:MAG: HAMP domain-containing sensor histidine kinase, partial [Nonlabens sp.]